MKYIGTHIISFKQYKIMYNIHKCEFCKESFKGNGAFGSHKKYCTREKPKIVKMSAKTTTQTAELPTITPQKESNFGGSKLGIQNILSYIPFTNIFWKSSPDTKLTIDNTHDNNDKKEISTIEIVPEKIIVSTITKSTKKTKPPKEPKTQKPPNAPKTHTKKTIPKIMRAIVWNTYIGREIGETFCLCCKQIKISQLEFHCGHVVSEACGGLVEIDNLRPVCATCNLSMGRANMIEFMQEYKFGELPDKLENKVEKIEIMDPITHAQIKYEKYLSNLILPQLRQIAINFPVTGTKTTQHNHIPQWDPKETLVKNIIKYVPADLFFKWKSEITDKKYMIVCFGDSCESLCPDCKKLQNIGYENKLKCRTCCDAHIYYSDMPVNTSRILTGSDNQHLCIICNKMSYFSKSLNELYEK